MTSIKKQLSAGDILSNGNKALYNNKYNQVAGGPHSAGAYTRLLPERAASADRKKNIPLSSEQRWVMKLI